MRVRKRNGIETFNAAGPQIRGDGVFAGIRAEMLLSAAKTLVCASAVDKERAAFGLDHQDERQLRSGEIDAGKVEEEDESPGHQHGFLAQRAVPT